MLASIATLSVLVKGKNEKNCDGAILLSGRICLPPIMPRPLGPIRRSTARVNETTASQPARENHLFGAGNAVLEAKNAK
jgi:hypothetical protein